MGRREGPNERPRLVPWKDIRPEVQEFLQLVYPGGRIDIARTDRIIVPKKPRLDRRSRVVPWYQVPPSVRRYFRLEFPGRSVEIPRTVPVGQVGNERWPRERRNWEMRQQYLTLIAVHSGKRGRRRGEILQFLSEDFHLSVKQVRRIVMGKRPDF